MISQSSGAALFYRLLKMMGKEMGRDLPMTVPMALMRIAMAGDGGINQLQLRVELKLSVGGIFRTLTALEDGAPDVARAGLHFIRREEYANDARQRICYITPAGRKFIQRMVDNINGKETK